jgi:hypothetical protein
MIPTNVSISPGGEWLYFTMVVENATSDKLMLSFPEHPDSPIVASTDDGFGYRFWKIAGVGVQKCNVNQTCRDTPTSWTTVYPGTQQKVLVEARGMERQGQPDLVDVSMSFFIKDVDGSVELISPSFSNLSLSNE